MSNVCTTSIRHHIRPIILSDDGLTGIIKLSRNYQAIIDAQDIEAVSARNWHAVCLSANHVYAASNIRTGEIFKQISLHRYLMQSSSGNTEIDHVNGNTLDNRRVNLRPVTRSQNRMNAVCRCDSLTGLKGIQFEASRGTWKVRIGLNKKSFHIGRYKTLEEAVEARRVAEAKMHGEHARRLG